MNVLHITPHVGGGVGTVLASFFEHSPNQSLYCLDTISDQQRETFSSLVPTMGRWSGHDLNVLVTEADVVLLHWWNHPLLFNLIVGQEIPACRMAMWSHVSGTLPTNTITDEVLSYPDIFVTTLPGEHTCIRSAIDISRFLNVEPVVHEDFVVGYHGTVSDCKMHGLFTEMCRQIAMRTDARFIVCGGPDHNLLRTSARWAGIANRMDVRGPIADPATYLGGIDVFGYPLAPHHYGTSEQVLGEAMAAGRVPVVFNNRAESAVVTDEVDGFIASNSDDYVSAVCMLIDPRLRETMGAAAREKAQSLYSVSNMVTQWDGVFDSLMSRPKTKKRWARGLRHRPCEQFVESLRPCDRETIGVYVETGSGADEVRGLFSSSPVWNYPTKGTAVHYASYFADDLTLCALKGMCE